ncbi:MAG TPA: hypothetical protein VLK84_30970 [Longimicrobium sp.]|nr:hypothetical protein [Longimicrobium sp.]
MAEKPSVWGHVRAWLQDEVPATMLEAYRRAGLSVFELMDRVQVRREACIADGFDAWSMPSALRAERLCAWNAFVLQTLGNALLDTDYAADPATTGFVPPATAEQALVYYAAVEGWLDRAEQAHANPGYVLDVEVPADLPQWTAERHLPALLRALHAVGEHAAAAVAMLPQAMDDPERQKQLHAIRQTFASARSKARHAQELNGPDLARDLHARVEWYARQAMELFFHLGQLVADPTRAGGVDVPAAAVHRPAKAVRSPLARPVDVTPRVPAAQSSAKAVDPPAEKAVAAPRVAARTGPPAAAAGREAKAVEPRDAVGSAPPPEGPLLPDFPELDVWCLTDARARRVLKSSRSLAAIRRLWAADPDPARTLALHDEIRAAFDGGDVAYAEDGCGSIGHYHCCPWGPIYVARRSLTLSGRRILKGQRFALDVHVEQKGRQTRFKRQLIVGRLQRADRVNYGDAEPRTPAVS